MHMQCTRGSSLLFFFSAIASYVGIKVVKKVCSWDIDHILQHLQKNFSVGTYCLHWKVEVNRLCCAYLLSQM